MMLRVRNPNLPSQENEATIGKSTNALKRRFVDENDDGAQKKADDNHMKHPVDADDEDEPQSKQNRPSQLVNETDNGIIDSSLTTIAEPNDSDGNDTLDSSAVVVATVAEDNNSDGKGEPAFHCILTPNIVPTPKVDFDEMHSHLYDNESVPEYAPGIFEYLRSREKYFTVSDYVGRIENFSAKERANVVDWMVEVQQFLELRHETLFLSVKLLDIYMSLTQETTLSKCGHPQLTAIACIGVASKFEEPDPPGIDDLLYVSADQFERDMFLAQEIMVLKGVRFDLGCPLSYVYLRRLARLFLSDMTTLTLSRYILETSLCFYEFVGLPESLLASGAFYLALRMQQFQKVGKADVEWTETLQHYSGYVLSEVEPFADELNLMLHRLRQGLAETPKVIKEKYSHHIFYEVAHLDLVPCKWEVTRVLMEGKPFNIFEPMSHEIFVEQDVQLDGGEEKGGGFTTDED